MDYSDQKLWFSSEGTEKVKESGVKASDMSDTQRGDKSVSDGSSKSSKTKTFIDKILKKQEVIMIVVQKVLNLVIEFITLLKIFEIIKDFLRSFFGRGFYRFRNFRSSKIL